MVPQIAFRFLIGCCLTVVLVTAETREPKTSLKQALLTAEKYLVDKKIDTSTLFMASIYRSEFPKNSKKSCWTILWAPKDAQILDGDLRIYVYDDGSINHGGSS